MRQSRTNRSKQEIIRDILLTIEQANVSKTKVMYRASLSYAQLKNYEDYLLKTNVMGISSDDTWFMTEKGKQYLAAYRIVEQIMDGAEEQDQFISGDSKTVEVSPQAFLQ